jgi:hypothetical protein
MRLKSLEGFGKGRWRDHEGFNLKGQNQFMPDNII